MIKHDDLTQDVKTKAQELGSDVKDAIQSEAQNRASEATDRAADRVTNAANAADAAANEFDPGSIQALAARQVADQVEGIAAHLRTANLTSVTRDISTFARNNPALFIGGAALLGFAATRFLKARDPQRVDHSAANHDPWDAQGTSNPASRGFDVPS